LIITKGELPACQNAGIGSRSGGGVSIYQRLYPKWACNETSLFVIFLQKVAEIEIKNP
jgi:hypothetical protein